MQEANLLNETNKKTGSGRTHDGRIITERPNTLWATDGKEFWTEQEGKCHFIGVIDHFDDQMSSRLSKFRKLFTRALECKTDEKSGTKAAF